MSEVKLYIRSRIDAGLITVESDRELISPVILHSDGTPAAANIISAGQKDGKYTVVFEASALKCWTPDTPVLYILKADNAVEKFGYCELKTFSNTDILLNGERFYMRGYIRGIKAHEHPNMTGGSLKDAAVKNIRQAKKYGFNLVRFHSTIPSVEFVEAADEEGLFIHMEIGFFYEYDEAGNKKSLDMDNRTWEETILKFRNHPSVAIFCIGNEMHNSGHQPGVYKLYDTGKALAPGKLIMDNSGWGEYDRPTADIFAQHIAYYFPYKHHKDMFITDDCWRLNGSTYDVPLTDKCENAAVQADIRREAVPLRPVLAHEALHYIDIPDYEALNKKFDDFCAKVGKEYLEANGIEKPRFMTELPKLIERKGLLPKLPDYIEGSRVFKKMGYKTYIERMRDSAICGYEMLQLADCLKYENKNGLIDCFDDDKFFDPAWVMTFNGDAALLGCFENEVFYYDEPVKMVLKISNFLASPRIRGDVKVTVDGECIYTGKDVALAGGLQKIAEITLNFKEAAAAKMVTVAAEFSADGIKLQNSWELWLYPHAKLSTVPMVELQDENLAGFINGTGAVRDCNAVVTDRLTDKVFAHLAEGKHVILLYHRDNPDQQYYWPGALERFKPCIWDRGSNLGGVINTGFLRDALAADRYFNKNMQPLLEACYKINLDDFPVPVREHIFGIDKPVRDRMKGLIHNIKDFIDTDTLRNFSHLFTVKAGQGMLTVCTMMPGKFVKNPVTENFFAAVFNNLDQMKAEESISLEALKDYLTQKTTEGVRREDVMNHFWEIDNKPVEDKLYWEEVQVDMRKHK
ncbi:MAG: hypothetical protein E7057_00445 [Lentisphaerae bacterium]|nr:hypothetical protein [Lentisphaerota bacterium]